MAKKYSMGIFNILIIIILISGNSFSQRRYFYTNRSYGSESLFNPITLIINGGFDICQLYEISDKLSDHNYPLLFKVVMKNLGRPVNNMKNFGINDLLQTELLPISFTRNKMQWIPNYQNHLIGGGILYTKMREWYEEHNYPVPWLMSSVTLMTQHLLNEMMETGPGEQISVDEVIDLYIFDIGGIILFSFDNVNEFFSETLNFQDWSLQATYLFPAGRIHAGQYFAMKWKFPFSDDWSLFYRYGLGGNIGLSKKIDDENNISFGAGIKTKHFEYLSAVRKEKTIVASWQAGLFWDKNNSLMFAFQVSGLPEYLISADVYPGILKFGSLSPGFWTIIGRDGTFSFGISTNWLVSLGYSSRK